MARKPAAEDGPKVLVLLHPDGSEYGSNSPAEITQLHYGLGYTFRDHESWHAALGWLGDDAAVPPPAPEPGPTESTD